MKILILIGPPGCGKGTQASFISGKYNFLHVSVGDLFRKEISSKTEIGLKVKEIIESGSLVSDDIVNELTINNIKGFCSEGRDLLLDGYPRSVGQAKFLDNFIKDLPNSLIRVIQIDVSEEVIKNRLTNRISCKDCGAIYNKQDFVGEFVCKKCSSKNYIQRKDDNEDSILLRLEAYEKSSKPVCDYYADRVLKIDGNVSVDEVSKNISNVLKNIF